MSKGDCCGLARAVVAALAQQAAGAAGAEQAAFGPLLGPVRERLGRLPRWRRALRRLGEAPGEEGARREAAEALEELLAIDPDLGRALAARWPAAPSAGAAGVTASGASGAGSGGGGQGGGGRGGGGRVLAAVLAVAVVATGLGLFLARSCGQRDDGRPDPVPTSSALGAQHPAPASGSGAGV
ncbi:hypothetical protein AB0O91_27660 [Kitasatospora sp. NPDC089797]|uniref:hypothetical protein n=1 Tax=Kitasatospora sp. NPDC089797 TaxID=3155298 RepID=UPI00342BCD1B